MGRARLGRLGLREGGEGVEVGWWEWRMGTQWWCLWKWSSGFLLQGYQSIVVHDCSQHLKTLLAVQYLGQSDMDIPSSIFSGCKITLPYAGFVGTIFSVAPTRTDILRTSYIVPSFALRHLR